MTSSDRGAKAHGFTPKVSVPERHPVQFKDPTLSIWLSKVWLSTFQLTTVAGAAVIAKSAVAPLERVKVRLRLDICVATIAYVRPCQLHTQRCHCSVLLFGKISEVGSKVHHVGRRHGFKRPLGSSSVHADCLNRLREDSHASGPSSRLRCAPRRQRPVSRHLGMSAAYGCKGRMAGATPMNGRTCYTTRSVSGSRAFLPHFGPPAFRQLDRRHFALQSLYRGNGINVLRVVPEVLLKFSIHDQLRVIVGATSMDSAQLPVSSRIAAGALTGVLRTALLHPLSVVRTRLTADMGDPAPRAARQRTHPGSSRHFSGIAQCVRETWQRERLRGFFGGFALASVASAPYLAVCFPVYELLVQTLPTEKQSVREWWYPFAKMGCATGAPFRAW